jgi:tetratricopeptide (TPR) repeat protein
VAPSEGSLQPGSIEDISRRLALWARRDSSGLVRVEYSSEFARQQVMQRLQALLKSQGIPLEELALPTFQDAETVVQTLVKRLEEIAAQPSAVVSVTGFATAFNQQSSLDDALRVLNFNRDRYVALPLRQIWWMTPAFMQKAIHAMPDLNSFFLQRLQLTEVMLPEADSQKLVAIDGTTTNIDDARQRAYGLIRQFEAAKTSDASPADLLSTYILPALEALAEVGAQKELRDLTQQFEGFLSQINVTDSADLASSLGRLANLYADQGRYSEAEPLFQEALRLGKQLLGDTHPDVVASLSNLAGLYESQGRYSEAEPLFQEHWQLRKQLLGEAHPDVASSLNNLAALYINRRVATARLKPHYQEALTLWKQLFSEAHPAVATSLNNLAELYRIAGALQLRPNRSCKRR